MLTEADVERMPDAVAGRELLDARLTRLTDEERMTFWEAVQRCYASAASDTEPSETK